MTSPLPSRNPLPQLIPARLRHLQEHIKGLIWQRERQLEVRRSEEQAVAVTYQQATSLDLQPLSPGTHFGHGSDHWTQFWLRTEIPPATQDDAGRRYLRWKCQGETTVWIDGRPWAGLDLSHETCPLPDDASTLWLQCCNWQTGIWISMIGNEGISSHGLRFDGAELVLRHELAWSCFAHLDAIVQVLEQALRHESDLKIPATVGYCRALEDIAPRFRRLLHDMNRLCDVWLQTPGLQELNEACDEFLRCWPAEHWQPTAAVCGHAHIDLVWLWPESATRKKIVHTVATTLRLMERYPDMVFTQSMPAFYRMLEEESVEMMTQVTDHIESGRWEVLGAFEVEPDTNLPGGEALARSIQLGQKKTQQLTGQISEIAWIPDVFGYNQCLPQIMALGGVRYFYTTKMTWSNITKFPYTSFIWRGADGTEVLSHLGTTNYSGEVLLRVHEEAMAQHRQADVHPELLLPTGYGDGGGGPTELHIERVRRFENLSGSPRTKWTRADQFFARLEQLRPQLPIYQGELYLEFHRGTYTTQSEFKRLYRRAEQGLQMHEAVRVALGMPPLPDEHWLRVLFAHFHDAIPGSSIAEVYAQMNPELDTIADREYALARKLVEPPAHNPQQDRSPLLAFNPLPYARTAVVSHDDDVYQIHMPALGSSICSSDTSMVTPILEASPGVLRHDRLTARFNAQGQLHELVIDGAPLELTSPAGFVLSPDDPAFFDAWDIDHHAARLGTRVAEQLSLRVVEHSPARAILESQSVSIGWQSELCVRYILEAGSIHLKVEPIVVWRESHQLLRFVIATSYRGRQARFGCPFGAIERPQLPGTETDEAMWEVPASRWAAVQYDGGADGLALLAASKLGYAARDGVLSVSLLRAPQWPDPAADLGSHTMPLAIGRLRLESDGTQLQTSMVADALFSEPLLYHGQQLPAAWHWKSLGSLNASWCSPSVARSDAFILRLHETAGRCGTAHLQLQWAAIEAELVDFLDRPLGSIPIDAHGGLSIPYRPWQIVSLRVTRRREAI